MKQGQTNIEMTFSVVVILIMFLGMIRVCYWVGNDLSGRRDAHVRTLTEPIGSDINENYKQIRPSFYDGKPMDAVTVSSNIFAAR